MTGALIGFALVAGTVGAVTPAEPVAAHATELGECGRGCEGPDPNHGVFADIKQASRDDRFTAREISRVRSDLPKGASEGAVARLMKKADNNGDISAEELRRIKAEL
jgi:hypothetical protein